jgi:hypothetical protein
VVITKYVYARKILPWFQRFIFIIFIAKGRGKINLWLKAAIDSSSRANQFEIQTAEYSTFRRDLGCGKLR